MSWGEFDRRSNALANALLAAGLSPQAKVAVYLRNCPEFIEAYVACFKARLVPVNVNKSTNMVTATSTGLTSGFKPERR